MWTGWANCKMKRGCNQPESVELLVSWLMTDAKRILSSAPCLWFAPRRVPTGERTLAGLQTPRCTAAPPAHSREQAWSVMFVLETTCSHQGLLFIVWHQRYVCPYLWTSSTGTLEDNKQQQNRRVCFYFYISDVEFSSIISKHRIIYTRQRVQ